MSLPQDSTDLKSFSKTLIKYISLYCSKKESCLQKLEQEEKVLTQKIEKFTSPRRNVINKRNFEQFRPGNFF